MIAIVVVLALAAVAAVVGLRIYGDHQNQAAAAPFSAPPAATGEVTPLEGTWQVGAGSEAGYRVDEVLNGQDVTVVGRTEDTNGSATFDGMALTAADVTVDLTTVATDNAQRDESFRTIVVDTAAHPEASFSLTAPVDVAALTSEGTATVAAPGTLSINGTTHDVSAELTLVRSAEGQLTVVGSIDLTWSELGVQAPKQPVVTV